MNPASVEYKIFKTYRKTVKSFLEEYYIEDDVILETIPEYICVLEELEEIQEDINIIAQLV